MTIHYLKLQTEYFDAVLNGLKTFEVRKNDRDYRLGDTLALMCFHGKDPIQRPNCIVCVTYILTHEQFPEGVPEGYVVMGIKRVTE